MVYSSNFEIIDLHGVIDSYNTPIFVIIIQKVW
jgi:hypothetical protein